MWWFGGQREFVFGRVEAPSDGGEGPGRAVAQGVHVLPYRSPWRRPVGGAASASCTKQGGGCVVPLVRRRTSWLRR